MAHPKDNTELDRIVAEIRAYQAKEATDQANAAADKRLAELDAAWQMKWDAHMATHKGGGGALDKVGIQVFPDRTDLSYGKDLNGTFNMLKFLGIKKVRGGLGPAMNGTVIDWYNKCYDELGIKVNFTVGKPRETLTNPQWDKITSHLSKLRGAEMLCGWNEPNHVRGGGTLPTNWPALTGTHQDTLWTRYRDQYVIGSMQMWSGNKKRHDADLAKVAPQVKGKFHVIAWHLYQPGENRIEDYEKTYYGHFGKLPVWCTETGMSTAPNQAQGALSMTEEEQGRYLTQHCGLYLKRGHGLYWFELRDEHDPAGTDREDWLGVFRADGTPKPAAHALKELLAA